MRYNSRLELDYKHTSKRKSASKKYRILAASALLSFLVIVPMGAYSLFVSEKTTPKHHVAEQSDSTHEEDAVNIVTIPLSLADQAQHSPQNSPSTITQGPSDQTNDYQHSIKQIPDSIEATVAERAPEVFNIKKHTKIIKTGDNLSSIFTSLGLNTELHEILQLGEPVKELKSIYPQQKIHFYLQDESLIKLELETSLNRQLQIIQQHESYVVNEVIRDFEIQTQSVHAVIENSLFLAGQRAGLSDAVIMQLANIFGWDIDFALDIRSGDQFSVIYEEKFLDGKKVKDGEILIAEFINSGKSFRAIRYTDSNNHTDYYSDNGHSMRKPFLRTPVDFARVSSKFNLKRMHPVLNTIRAHKGVDYAATTGTPIKSAGDGKVIFRGTKRWLW